ncbi:MAG: aspartate carbamoyltransferase catalytic subunit [Sphingomonadales bacterium]|nr:MAG: aspartate carbamoyltransferase catalytic subunit [Sphingomonadales bacterium]
MADYRFPHRHLLGIEGLNRLDIETLLELGDRYVELNRTRVKHANVLAGQTLVNLFFENSTRTQGSFEIAGKRLGADVVNMHAAQSSVKKGETLIDTAMTLNAMRADVIVIRHMSSGAVRLIADKVGCPVLNAGDGRHEHPTQALLDALTIRRRVGDIGGMRIAICGDILHSRVARSNVACLNMLGAEVRLIAPRTLTPPGAGEWGAKVFTDMREGLQGCDVVMMLRLQQERMDGAYLPSAREFFHFWGLDEEKLSHAKPGAFVMHPGPMNRGVEIESGIADHKTRSLITEQVEMGVAIRMAVLETLAKNAPEIAKAGAEK